MLSNDIPTLNVLRIIRMDLYAFYENSTKFPGHSKITADFQQLISKLRKNYKNIWFPVKLKIIFIFIRNKFRLNIENRSLNQHRK